MGLFRVWSSQVVVLKSTAKKCTKNYNARAQPFLWSLNLLFSDFPVEVAVVVFLKSLNVNLVRLLRFSASLRLHQPNADRDLWSVIARQHSKSR